jgi:hypothetical protein
MAIAIIQIPLEASVLDVPWGLTRDISLSVEYYLRTKNYERDNVEGSVFDHFRDANRKNTDITFERDFPDDITKLPLPAIALSMAPDMDTPEETMAAGGRYIQERRHYSLYGFAGGEKSDTIYKNNGAQMTALRDDLYYLFNGDHGDGVVIDMYHFDAAGAIDSTYSSVGLMINDVTVTSPGTTGVTQAERYRFVMDFTVTALTSRR